MKELKSKQRAYLMKLASSLEPIFQIGKSSLTPECTAAIAEAFNTRELIKISVLKNCFDDPREIAAIVAERTHSTVVQVIGKKNRSLQREQRPQENRTSPVTVILPMDKGGSL